MPNATPCPPSADLRRYLLGEVPEAGASAIDDHLERCPACVGVLAAANASDTLLEMLPAAAKQRRPSNPLIDRLVSRLAELSKVQPALRTRANASGSVQDTEAPARTFAGVAPEGTSPVTPPPPGQPLLLGDYRIVRELGRGGMGVVYEAEDVKLRRSVALKVMAPELAARQDARQRFLQEARATAALEHENVVAIFHVGEEGGVPFLAMPLLQGETLEQRLHREPKLTVAEVVRLAREAAEGLAAAHEKGLIHRDVKPGNLWLARLGADGHDTRVKILDFGLARSLAGDVQLTSPGAFMGTPAYVAPEQARGEEVDGRADLFSLGCVLYRMLTGKRPFAGETSMAQLRSLELDTPVPPQQLDPTIPPPVSQLTMRLLAKRAAERPPSAGAVVKWLRAIEGNLMPAGPYPMAIPVLPPLPPPPLPRPAADEATVALPQPGAVAPRAKVFHAGCYVVVAASLLIGAVGVAGLTRAIWPPDRGDEHARVNDKRPAPDPERPKEQGKIGEQDDWKVDRRRPDPEPGGRMLEINSLVSSPAKKKGLDSWTIGTNLYAGPVDAIACRHKPFIVRFHQPSFRWRHFDLAKCEFVAIPFGSDAQTSADEQVWLTGDGKTVSIGTVGDEKAPVRKLIDFPGGVDGSALSPSGGRVAVVNRGKLTLWDAQTRESVNGAGWPVEGAVGLSWSPNGEMIVCGTTHRIQVYSRDSGKVVTTVTLGPDRLTSLAWSPDSSLLCTLADGYADVWEIKPEGKRLIRQASIDGAPAWSPKEKVLAFARGNDVVLWGVAENKEIRTLTGHRGTVTAVGYTPDGATVISASQDGSIRTWDARTGKHLGTLVLFSSGRFIALSPQGYYTGPAGVEADFVFRIRYEGKAGIHDLEPKKFADEYGSMKEAKHVQLLAETPKDKER